MPGNPAGPALVYEHTSKWNTVAVVSDGTRVLGLGDIGPKAGLPVMEGKALLFKYLGGVDAVPLMLDTKDPDEIIHTVLMLQPGFGGVNLEDITQPKCFRILDTLREECEIPIWHDDQQGTACVTVAGLLNALKIVGKPVNEVRVVFIGSGAANVAISRLCFKAGVDPAKALMVDSQGILGRGRRTSTSGGRSTWTSGGCARSRTPEGGRVDGGSPGGGGCRACSAAGPARDDPAGVGERQMAHDAIVFACANPVPEIWPWEAEAAGAAIVATGRSDFPQPGQQLARLPRHLPWDVGCAGQDDHRRDVHRSGGSAGGLGAGWGSGSEMHPAGDDRMGSVRPGGGGGRHEGAGAGDRRAGILGRRVVLPCRRHDPLFPADHRGDDGTGFIEQPPAD